MHSVFSSKSVHNYMYTSNDRAVKNVTFYVVSEKISSHFVHLDSNDDIAIINSHLL